MKKKLREAIENVGMVNNVDGQNFDKDFVGTAPVSYADAVLKMRAKREQAKQGCQEQTKRAKESLKKEISNAEHPEPLDKIKVNEEGRMTLDEGLFESLAEERSDTSLAKEALDEIIERIHLGMSGLMELLDLDISDDARSRLEDVAIDIAQVLDTLSLVARKHLKESFDDEHLGHEDDVCPKCGKNPCECKIEEGAEEKKVYRVTYKHSPEVFSSVMVKAANEDEAKQKLSVEKPGKDIIGVSVMSADEVKDMTNRGMSLMEAKIIDDFSSYEPWGAAVSTFDNIQNADKMDALEQLIDDMYPDDVDRTELNDLLAFESDWVYSMLDMPNEEEE